RYFIGVVQIEVMVIILLMIVTTSVYSQSAWDIEYVSTDSLLSALIGQEMRLDFKASVTDTLQGDEDALSTRYLLFREDTICLILGGQSEKFKERWIIYPDWGIIKDQTLEKIDSITDGRVYIREMYLVSINDTTL